jgi:hypothetical protein
MSSFEREVLEGMSGVTRELQLLRVSLLGSAEDGFKAGRLPVLEADFQILKNMVESHLSKTGTPTERKKFSRTIRWLGRVLAGAIGYLAHEFMKSGKIK